MPPLILGIDTATSHCSVALFEGRELLSFRESAEIDHSQRLAPFINELLEEGGLQVSNLSALAVMAGPGSYTGLRIGVSIAKGLCFASGIPLLSVSSLDSLIYALPDEVLACCADNVRIAPMLNARRMEVYMAWYNRQRQQVSPLSATVITETSFAKESQKHSLLFIGEGAVKCQSILSLPNLSFFTNVLPSAKHMGTLSLEKFFKKQFEDVAYFEPIYLKDFIATSPKKNLLREASSHQE